MKIKETSPGKVYALDSMNGCEVMNGNVVVQVPAMTQTIVIANSDCLTSEDDTVTITEVFKLAPALYRQGEDGGNWMKEAYDGLVSIVGEDNFKWEFLDNPYRVVVHTDRLDDEQLAAVTALLERVLPENLEVVQYNHHIEVSWRDINKYAECETAKDVLAVNPDYMRDVTSEGEWCYNLTNLRSFMLSGGLTGLFSGYNGEANKSLSRVVRVTCPKLTDTQYGFYCNPVLEELDIDLPAAVAVLNFCGARSGQRNFRTLKIKMDNAETFQIGTSGNPLRYLQNVEFYAPKLKTTSRAFNMSILTKQSALNVLNALPKWESGTGTHTLLLGIHVDHKNDEELAAAIEAAKPPSEENNFNGKGWEVDVQWNGTATAQANVTYGLRQPPIYARMAESTRTDGTIEQYLLWAHHVTCPEKFEEFRSVEAAREYFNLPAEEEETIIEEQ